MVAFMHHRVITLALLSSIAPWLESCEESHPTQPVTAGMVISFLDRGAVVPDPISTLVIIRALLISSESKQAGVTIRSWDSEIESAEYDRIVSIVQDNHLVGAPDPSAGARPCVGAREMLVVINAEGILDTLKIAGVVRCDTTTWPAGLNSLINLQSALVEKYSP